MNPKAAMKDADARAASAAPSRIEAGLFRANGDMDRLAAKGRSVLPGLLVVLEGGDYYQKVCAVACISRMLGKGVDCSDAKPLLRETLKNGNSCLKAYSAHVLGRMGDLESIPEIAKGLPDKDHVIRWHCAGALEALGPASVPELLKALYGKNEIAKREARRSLVIISNERPGSVPLDALEEMSRMEREDEVLRSHGAVKHKQVII